MVESREVHVPKEWLLHTSCREAEVCIPVYSSVCAWLGRSLHSSISSLLTPFPPTWFPLSVSQPAWLLLLHCRLHGSSLSVSPRSFKMLSPELPMWPHIHPLLWCTTFASSPVPFTFFRLPSLVRARVLHNTGAFALPGYIASHSMLLKSHIPFTWGSSTAINLSLLCKVS